MDEAETAKTIIEIATSGGGMALLGWAVAVARQALKTWQTQTELHLKLMAAQLAALGPKPEEVPLREAVVAKDVAKIRIMLETSRQAA